ncbi:MAG: hypothetical protein ABIG89_01570 [Candidatus Woesearchaeota archaeon]
MALTIKPFGCHSDRVLKKGFSDDVYFGMKTINFVHSSDCYDYVSTRYKFCHETGIYYYFEDMKFNFTYCMNNPQDYSFSSAGNIITIDNIRQSFYADSIINPRMLNLYAFSTLLMFFV